MNEIVNSLPSGFSSSNLSSASAKLNSLEPKLVNISSTLISIKNTMEGILDDETIASDLLDKYYSKVVTLSNGQSGYLYVPKGYASTTGLPLLVWLSAKGEMPYTSSLNRSGLPKLLKDGLEVNAVIWVPKLTTGDHWCNDRAAVDIGNPYYDKILSEAGGNTKNVYTTMVSCEELVDKLKLDNERINIFGYSAGAYGVGLYTTVCPNYFATCTTYGGAYRMTPTESKTTYIYINENTGLMKEAIKAYDSNISNGNQAVLYRINGASHTDCTAAINQDLLNDIFNIRLGQKLNTPDGIVDVTREEMLASSILENGDGAVENNWYQSLLPKENSTSNSSSYDINTSQLEPKIETNSNNEEYIQQEPTSATESTSVDETIASVGITMAATKDATTTPINTMLRTATQAGVTSVKSAQATVNKATSSANTTKPVTEDATTTVRTTNTSSANTIPRATVEVETTSANTISKVSSESTRPVVNQIVDFEPIVEELEPVVETSVKEEPIITDFEYKSIIEEPTTTTNQVGNKTVSVVSGIAAAAGITTSGVVSKKYVDKKEEKDNKKEQQKNNDYDEILLDKDDFYIKREDTVESLDN